MNPRHRIVVGSAVVAVALLLGLAGAGEGKKCTLPTQQCLDQMAQKMKSTGWIGVELDDHPKSGLMEVAKVVPGSPAEAAGIRPGDVFIAADGAAISMEKPDALVKAKAEWKPGKQVVLTIRRDGVDREVAVELAPMPADMLARYIGEHMLEHAALAAARK